MSDTFVISGLVRKRAELSGTIAEMERQLAEARHNLVHIDGTLRLFGYEDAPEAIKPRRSRPSDGIFQPRERQRMILEALRQNPAGITTPDLAVGMMRRKGLNVEDQALRRSITTRTNTIMSRLARQGVVERGELDGSARRWRVAPHPDGPWNGNALSVAL